MVWGASQQALFSAAHELAAEILAGAAADLTDAEAAELLAMIENARLYLAQEPDLPQSTS